MSPSLRALLPSLCLVAAACSGGPSIPLRNGPEFEVAFPDPSVLVTTNDVSDVRSLLSTVVLPATDEHHDRLLQILAEADSIGTEHLLLLTEAVALDASGTRHNTITYTNGSEVFVWSRGNGDYFQVVDELLLNGVSKVDDPSPRGFGELIGRAQTRDSVVALANKCASLDNAAKWDDGSAKDLEEILDWVRLDSIRLELCVDALLPAGRIDDARADAAVRSFSFDSGRVDFVRADYRRRNSLSAESLLAHVEEMSFDSGRTETIELGAPIVTELNGNAFLRLVETASFDDGRVKIVDTLSRRASFSDASEPLALVQAASFDSGRSKILDALVAGPFVDLNGQDLVAFVETASFDSGRGDILDLIRPHVHTSLNAQELRTLLDTASFDSGRQRIVEIFVTEFRRLPATERLMILDAFSFESGKKEARKTLDW